MENTSDRSAFSVFRAFGLIFKKKQVERKEAMCHKKKENLLKEIDRIRKRCLYYSHCDQALRIQAFYTFCPPHPHPHFQCLRPCGLSFPLPPLLLLRLPFLNHVHPQPFNPIIEIRAVVQQTFYCCRPFKDTRATAKSAGQPKVGHLRRRRQTLRTPATDASVRLFRRGG